jgi:hypothetical protein
MKCHFANLKSHTLELGSAWIGAVLDKKLKKIEKVIF